MFCMNKLDIMFTLTYAVTQNNVNFKDGHTVN